jgi:hypothetical protein
LNFLFQLIAHFGEKCKHNSECLEPMNCDIDNVCKCSKYEYHNASTLECLPKQLNNEPCFIDLNCREDKYLECKNGICSCISQYPLWIASDNVCIVPPIYTEYCDAEKKCNVRMNLVCNDVDQCDCERELNKEFYWNDTYCVEAISYYEKCMNESPEDMCKTLTEGTICALDDQEVEYICRCSLFEYFDLTDIRCKNQVTEGSSCSQKDACRIDAGLSCQNDECKCNETIDFWNGISCQNVFTYNEGNCLNDGQCAGDLICRSSNMSSCNCPTNILVNRCDCQREIGNEFFRNTDQCVPSFGIGQPCSFSYECMTLTERTTCEFLNSKGVCKCPTLFYFNNNTKKCENQLYESNSCPQYDACRNDRGLSCINGECKCDETLNFWNGVNCQSLLAYNTGNCLNDRQCSSNLICRNSSFSSCNCPSNVFVSRCDCPPRQFGIEFFWNVTECVPALQFGKPCSFSHQCMTLTESTICVFLNSQGTCKCPTSFFFNNFTKKCEAQLSLGNVCIQEDACRSILGLICQFGTCVCNLSTPFWIGSQCSSVWSYNNGPCTNDSDCSSNLVCLKSGQSCNCPTNVAISKCDCPSRTIGQEYYWSGNTCLPATTFGNQCSFDYECQTLTQETVCELGTCMCATYQYFDYNFDKCQSKVSHNESCTEYDACLSYLNLICKNSKCVCDSSYQYWNGNTCVDYLLFNNGPCYRDNECSGNLRCLNIGPSCNCPTNVAISKCDCPSRTIGQEYYWSGNTCLPAKTFGNQCSFDYECQTLTQGTICSRSCSCPPLEFFNTTNVRCQNQLHIGETCLQYDSCRSDLGLVCENNICNCDSEKQFFNGFLCMDYYTYDNGPCFGDSQCAGNLICRYFDESCDCPLKISSEKCDCPTRRSHDEWFWNGSTCEMAHQFFEPCSNDYMCQTYTQGTVCLDQICQCKSGEILSNDETGYRCTATIFKSCFNDSDCFGRLYCKNSTCACLEDDIFCYNSALNWCASKYECISNLDCIEEKCQCPREIDNEYYFKGNECVKAVSFGNKCRRTEECQYLTENTKCIKGICQCDPTGIFISNLCLTCLANWTLIRESCFIQSSQKISSEDTIPNLNNQTIQDICYYVSSARLGRIYNHEVKYVMSFFEPENDEDSMYIDAQQQDVLSSNFISSDKQFILPYKIPYWSKTVKLPINDTCLVINSNYFFEPDKCNKEHFILCEYDL